MKQNKAEYEFPLPVANINVRNQPQVHSECALYI